MARPPNTDTRRAEIVEGLLRVMAARGYERASIKEIAAAAGLSPGLVHYHFAAKQDILLALVERIAETVRARHARRAEGATTPRARLDAFVDAHLALGVDADPLAVACWVAIGAEAVRQPEVGAAYREALSESVGVLEALLAAAGDPTPRPHALAVLAAIEGSYQLAATGIAEPGFAAPSVRAMISGLLP